MKQEASKQFKKTHNTSNTLCWAKLPKNTNYRVLKREIMAEKKIEIAGSRKKKTRGGVERDTWHLMEFASVQVQFGEAFHEDRYPPTILVFVM